MLGPCTDDVADFWSIGVILYELYTGANFRSVFPTGLLSHTPVIFNVAAGIQRDADIEDLISSLLRPNPMDRLGFKGLEGQKAARNHPFFKHWQWKLGSKS